MEHSVELQFSAPGATPNDVTRAIEAAWAVFDAANVTPWAAAAAAFKQEAEDDVDDLYISPEEGVLAEVWRAACREATDAGCSSGLSKTEADFWIVH